MKLASADSKALWTDYIVTSIPFTFISASLIALAFIDFQPPGYIQQGSLPVSQDLTFKAHLNEIASGFLTQVLTQRSTKKISSRN
jgi:hypothetical protein